MAIDDRARFIIDQEMVCLDTTFMSLGGLVIAGGSTGWGPSIFVFLGVFLVITMWAVLVTEGRRKIKMVYYNFELAPTKAYVSSFILITVYDGMVSASQFVRLVKISSPYLVDHVVPRDCSFAILILILPWFFHITARRM